MQFSRVHTWTYIQRCIAEASTSWAIYLYNTGLTPDKIQVKVIKFVDVWQFLQKTPNYHNIPLSMVVIVHINEKLKI